MEQLLNVVVVSRLVVFAVAIFFASAVPNEIAPETEHDHEEMDRV
jgi:hypothetical protein